MPGQQPLILNFFYVGARHVLAYARSLRLEKSSNLKAAAPALRLRQAEGRAHFFCVGVRHVLAYARSLCLEKSSNLKAAAPALRLRQAEVGAHFFCVGARQFIFNFIVLFFIQ